MAMNGRKKRGQQGFTLLELLIAIVVMTIGLFAVATMQGVAMRANAVSNKISVGTMLAQQAAEEILSRSSTDVLFSTALSNVTYGAVTVPGAGTFSMQYSIAPDTPIAGTTRVTVFVTPTGAIIPSPFQYTMLKRVD